MELEDELFQRHAQEEKLYRAVLAEYQEFLSLPSTQETLQSLDYNASLSDYGEALRSLGEIIEGFRSSLPARGDCELSAWDVFGTGRKFIPVAEKALESLIPMLPREAHANLLAAESPLAREFVIRCLGRMQEEKTHASQKRAPRQR